jgi:predicted kinase
MKLIQIERTENTHKHALQYILDAWDEATANGVQGDTLATAALFTALSALVDSHGEEAVSALTERLAKRIEKGEFSVGHATH